MSLNHFVSPTDPVGVSLNPNFNSCLIHGPHTCGSLAVTGGATCASLGVTAAATCGSLAITTETKTSMTVAWPTTTGVVPMPYSCPPLLSLTAALAAVQAGTSDAYILVHGDSNTAGAFGGTPPNNYTGNPYPNTPAAQLASLFAAAGYNTSADALIGARNTVGISDYNSFDSRVSTPGGWNLNNGSGGATHLSYVGGGLFNNTTTLTDIMTYTPSNAFDTLDLFYARSTNNGIATVKVDGVVVATLNMGGTAATIKTTVTGLTLATHTIAIQATSLGTNPGGVWLNAIIPRNSQQRTVYFHCIAAGGAQASDMLDTNFGLAPFLSAAGYPYCLMTICLGTNEAGASIAPTTFQTNLQARCLLIRQTAYTTVAASPPSCSAFGCDVVCVTEPPADPVQSATYAANQDGEYTVLTSLHPRYPVVDMRALAGYTYAAAVANGYVYSGNGLHWQKAGYLFVAQRVFNTLQIGMKVAQSVLFT